MFYNAQELIEQLQYHSGLQIEKIDESSDITSAYFIPENSSTPLVITWDNSQEQPQIKLIYAIGKISLNIPSEIILEILSLNLILATYIGPKLSYSKSTQMLTLTTCFSPNIPYQMSIDDINNEIEIIVKHGVMINEKLYESGYPLLDKA